LLLMIAATYSPAIAETNFGNSEIQLVI
jgi:hypothetical protein